MLRLVPMLRLVLLITALSSAFAKVLVGELVKKAHNVSGTLYALNTRTLSIENFYYDGTGPAAAFWLNEGDAPTTKGRVPPFIESCEPQERIPKYSGETVVLELPPDLTLADVGYFSVWCIQAKTEFGGIPVNASSLENLPELEEALCPSRLQQGSTLVFEVRKNWNCEPLNANYQVRWRLNSDKTVIDFELVARLRNGDQWMGFGPSGSSTGTAMIGSDVAIAYRRDDVFFADDYHLSAQRPCDPPEGVCPDILRNQTHGTDDVTNVSGNFKDNITMVRYTRPVKAVDTELDKDIVIDGPAFVTWAYGPLKVENLQPLYHLEDLSFPKEPVSIEFGREPENNCNRGSDAPVEEPVELPGFERPVLYNVTSITARIGTSGGIRGVAAISKRPSWGIAWYLSETEKNSRDILIPVLGVERGKKYTFKIYGGIPLDERDTTVHPFYITSSDVGGYALRSPSQRAKEKTFAGITNIKKNSQGGVVSFRASGAGELCKLESNTTDTAPIATYDDYYTTLNRSCVDNPVISENGGELVWEVAADTPDNVYYQCVSHENLGYKIRVFDSGKVNVDKLRQLSGGGSVELEEEEDVSCIADFKGERRRFDGCSKSIGDVFDVFWNVDETANTIETLFRAEKQEGVGYVGIGWGYQKMPGSNAVIAFETEDGPRIRDYFLEDRTTEAVQPNTNQKLISSDSDNSGDFLRGLFTRSLTVDGLPTITRGRTDIIWAVGDRPDSATSLSKHGRKGSAVVDLTSQGEQTSEETNDLDTALIIHAVFMGIAWLLLVPVAITIMRYFKKYNPVSYNLHRGINGTAVLLTIAGFIMGIVSGSRTETAHLVIGCVVFSLAIVQVLLGALRPYKGKKLRKPWFWGHLLLGSVLSGLGIANCFIGIGNTRVGGPVGWYIAAGVVTGLLVLIQIILGFMPNTFPRGDEEEEKAKLRAERTGPGGRTFVRED